MSNSPKLSTDRLRMPSTMDAPSAEALKNRLDQEKQANNDPASDNPKRKREFTFPFQFVCNDGVVMEGNFKNRVLNVGDRMLAGALCSDLVQGRNFASLPGTAQELAVAVSWMTYSLDSKMRPEWAKDLTTIDDERLILALYGEVWDHQSTFLGRKNVDEQEA